MRLSQTARVIEREYRVRIKSPGFWIGTVALPLFLGAWTVLPSLVLARTRASERLLIVDGTGRLERRLTESFAERGAGDGGPATFTAEVATPSRDPAAQRAALDRRLLDGEIDAWVWIPADALDSGAVEYHSESVSNFLTQEALKSALSAALRSVRFEDAGYDSETIEELGRDVTLETVRVSEEGSSSEAGAGGIFLALGLFFLLYIGIITYGSQIMLAVLEEKSSRIVEVILSAVRPFELMLGKLVGVLLAALTQLGIWLTCLAIFTAPGVVALMALPDDVTIPTLEPSVAAHCVLLFLLGFFLYGTFYAMLGAAFNDQGEAQQLSFLGIFLLVAPMAVMMSVINDPDSTLAQVTSLIPVFTPLVMMLRIAVKTPPLWQILLGYGLTALTCLVAVWFAGRIYRVGILMYGKKPTFQELWRWVRYP